MDAIRSIHVDYQLPMLHMHTNKGVIQLTKNYVLKRIFSKFTCIFKINKDRSEGKSDIRGQQDDIKTGLGTVQLLSCIYLYPYQIEHISRYNDIAANPFCIRSQHNVLFCSVGITVKIVSIPIGLLFFDPKNPLSNPILFTSFFQRCTISTVSKSTYLAYLVNACQYFLHQVNFFYLQFQTIMKAFLMILFDECNFDCTLNALAL